LNIITTKEQLDEMVAYYLQQDSFAYDLETVGPQRGVTVVNEVLWISLATHGRGDVIPLGHPNGEFKELIRPLKLTGERRKEAGLPLREQDYSTDDKKATTLFGPPPEQLLPAEVFAALKPLMFGEGRTLVGHNLVFDLTSIAKYYDNQFPTGPYFDTMIASFLYDNKNKNKCGLDDCLSREFGYHMVKGVGKEVEKYAFSTVAKYAYLDAKYTYLLYTSVLQKKLEEGTLVNVMSLEMGVLKVLCHMKLAGAPIDTEQLFDLHAKLEINIETARSEIYRIAGKVFNINSNPEKQAILYGKKEDGGQGLKPKVLTLKGKNKESEGIPLETSDYSVSSEALELYRESNELAAAILTYADLNKMLSTYVIPYLGGDVTHTVSGKSKTQYKESLLINGKIHCDFIQHGAETGRFSSRNPNLQNIPAPEDPEKVPEDKQYGRMLRNLFAAPEGYKLVVADYSQIEPRVIASMSKDPIMMKNYLEGGDIYTTIGDTMGVNRKAGKVLVLSIAYGVGPDKIAKQIGCTLTEAKTLLDDFSKKFNSINKYRLMVVNSTRQKGYVTTVLGRRRYLPEITSKNFGDKAGAERQAFNTRIQGSAADIMKLAMIRAQDMIPKEAKLLLTVHDELVTLTPDSRADETAEAIRAAMEGIKLLDVPLLADVKIVQRWGQAK
jgi:DNA polymerase I-like protein with 3'-5' exonuclease and polymerase domains